MFKFVLIVNLVFSPTPKVSIETDKMKIERLEQRIIELESQKIVRQIPDWQKNHKSPAYYDKLFPNHDWKHPYPRRDDDVIIPAGD